MDLRLYESVAKKINKYSQESSEVRVVEEDPQFKSRPAKLFNSSYSGSSNSSTINYSKFQGFNSEALEIAVRIFNEYLSFEAPYLIILDEKIRVALYQRFGC